MLSFLGALLLGCSSPSAGSGPQGSADTVPEDTDTATPADSGETGAHPVAFDECAGRTGAEVDVETVAEFAYFTGEPAGVLVVLADQAALESFWAEHGLTAREPMPDIAFATRQAVYFFGADPSCAGTRVVEGFYVDAADPAALVGKVRVEPGNGCDTGVHYALDVWDTPRAAVSSCEYGTRFP